MYQGRPQGLARGRVPEPGKVAFAAGQGGATFAAGQDGGPIGAKGHAVNCASMRQGRAKGPAGGRVPQPRRAVFTGCQDGPSVTAEFRLGDLSPVLERLADGSAGGRLPQ